MILEPKKYEPSPYWKFLYDSLRDRPAGGLSANGPIKLLGLAGYYFQKGIACFMVEDDQQAERLMKRVQTTLDKIHISDQTAVAELYLFLSSWLLPGEPGVIFLQQAVKKTGKEISRALLRVRNRTCCDLVIRAKLQVDREVIQAKDGFSDKGDHHTYESVADLMIALARLEMCYKNYPVVRRYVASAQGLYARAIRAVTVEVALEKPQWADTASQSDAFILESGRADGNEIIKTRHLLRGNLPLGRRQGEMLQDMADYLYRNDPGKLHPMREKLGLFFEDVISGKNRGNLDLGLLETITWVYLRKVFSYRIFNQPLDGSPPEILRKVMGGGFREKQDS